MLDTELDAGTVHAVGDAASVLWETGTNAVAEAQYRFTALECRLRAACDADGAPVAWMQVYDHRVFDGEAPAPLPYAIPHQSVAVLDGPRRDGGAGEHACAVECFIDELAHRAGRDPARYRRALIADPDCARTFDVACAHAGWDVPPARGQARGLAIVDVPGARTVTIATVRAGMAGFVFVERIHVLVEAGRDIDVAPEAQQVREATLRACGRIARVWPGFDASHAEVHVAVRRRGRANGVSGTHAPAVAAAVANAAFALTGERLRDFGANAR